MGRFRHSFGSRRAAISAFALYALFLQGFFAAAAQAEALNFPFGSICAPAQSGTQLPGSGQNNNGFCCILACAACGCAYLASESGDSPRASCLRWSGCRKASFRVSGRTEFILARAARRLIFDHLFPRIFRHWPSGSSPRSKGRLPRCKSSLGFHLPSSLSEATTPRSGLGMSWRATAFLRLATGLA